MASRVAEVVYRLKDLFTGPAKKVEDGYKRVRRASRDTANAVEKDNQRVGKSFAVASAGLKRFIAPLAVFLTARRASRAIGEQADDLDRLGKAARKLNLDPQELAGLEFAAERSGIEIGKVEKSLFTLQKRAGEAARGIGAAKNAFEEFGIDVAAFNALSVDEQVKLLADQLAGLSNEADRGALASAIFGKENAQSFLNLLNEGSAGIEALTNEYAGLRQITKESTDQAEAFNDIWTNLSTSVGGFFQRSGDLAIRGFVKLGTAVGLATKEVKSLPEQLAEARGELERLQSVNSRSNTAAQAVSAQVREVERLVAATEAQAKAQQKAAEEQRKLDAARIAGESADARYKAGLESLTTSIENQASSAKRLLDQQTTELRAARQEQQTIEEEFAQLRDEVTATPAEDITGLDVQTKTLEARRKLAEGDAEGAIKAAREGADLLRDLKAEGDEAGFVLGFLADQLGRVANEAAKGQTDQEVLDVAKEAEKFNVLTAKFNQLQSDATTQGTAIGKALVNSIAAELRAADLGLGDAVQRGLADFRNSLELERRTPKP